MKYRCLFSVLISLIAATATADPVSVPWTTTALFAQVAPMKNKPIGDLPFICIQPFKTSATDDSYSRAVPLPPDVIRELVKRDLTQSIPFNDKYIAYAKALQDAGAAVVMMEGGAFNGPADDVPDAEHHLPADFKRDPDQPAQQPHYPCPLLVGGWEKKRADIKTMMLEYKKAGVNVDAVWLDWEVEPYAGRSQWREAAARSRCRQMFPPGILDDFERYRAYITAWRADLFSKYVSQPILDVYPRCSITNWESVESSAKYPTPNWTGSRTIDPVDIGAMTATNPVVYGDTIAYDLHWNKDAPIDQAQMDKVYTQVMLGQIAGDQVNRALAKQHRDAVPWVDRFCADDTNDKIPILSTSRYREIWRHCWLRGVVSMQIFNPDWFPTNPGRVGMETQEVKDVVEIYDEMLQYRAFLEHGTPLAGAVSTDGPIWSAVQLKDSILLRTFNPGDGAAPLTVKPFDKADPVTLNSPAEGATYILERHGRSVKVTPQ